MTLATGQSAPAPAEPVRILLVEDNAVNQMVAKGFLTRRNYSVTAVDNGREALALLERDPNAFHVILMDIQMPEMDGFAATEAIRQRESVRGGARTPIIAMTAHVLIADRARCLAAGMDGYVTKPILPELLFAEIGRVVHESQGGIVRRGIADSIEETTQRQTDRERLLQRVEGDAALLAQMVAVFERDGERLVQAIALAIRGRDAEALERSAHTLKGMVSNFTGGGAVTAAAQLEEKGRNKRLEDAALVFATLQQELAALRPLLADLCAEVAT